MKKPLIGLLFLLAFNLAFSQNAKEDFLKISEAYKKNQKLSMNVVYSVYSNHFDKTFIYQSTGVYKKENANYYNSLMGAETIVNSSKMLTIHNEQKAIALSPAKPINGMDISGINLETILKIYKTVEFVNKSEKIKGYRVSFKDGSNVLNKFEIYFNAETHLMTKMVMYYNRPMEFSQDGKGKTEKPRLEIEFNNIDTSPRFSKDEFDLEKYIVFGKKAKLKSPYQNYRFIESKI